jgi:iron complex outermembrane receptor protein
MIKMRTVLLAGVAAMTVVPGYAVAQQVERAANDVASSDSERDPQGNEILVTAQRRSERLQDVPISVAAISAAALARSGFTNAQDIQYLTPSLQVNRAGSEVFQVRGVGTPITGYYLEQSVGVVVDGVPIALPSDIGLGALPDIAQIEVLRGPQGTLFGKNTSAGLVNITTRLPTLGRYTVDGRASYGSRDDTRLALNVNVPIGETIAATMSGAYQHQDGFIFNVLNSQKLGDYTDKAVRAKLLWQPTASFEVRLSGDYQERDGSDPAYVFTFRSFGPGGPNTGYGSAAFDIVPGPDNTTVAQDSDVYFGARRRGLALTMIYKPGDFTVTSITAYRKVSTEFQTDNDAGPVRVSVSPHYSNSDQFSQELRVEAPKNDVIDAQAGLFYYSRQGEQFFRTHGTFDRAPLTAPLQFYSFSGGLQHDQATNENYAAFADATWHIIPGLDLEIGGRYTHDTVSADYSVTRDPTFQPLGAPIPVNGYQDRYSKDDLSYRTSLQYKFTPDIMTYASYSRGYKGPGFAGTNAALVRIKPEIVKAVEFGIKASFFDNMLSANLAAFHSKFTNFQTQAVDPVTRLVSLTNAGGQRTQGLELEVTARPVKGLNLSGNIAYTDAEFTDYVAPCYLGQTAALGCVPAVVATSTTRASPSFYQAAGVPLQLVGKWSSTLAANYSAPIGSSMMIELNGNLFYKSSSYSSLDPLTRLPSYTVVNGNIGFGPQDGSWKVSVFARNLFDDYFVAKVTRLFNDGLLNTPTTEARRTIGLQLSFAVR